MIIYDSPCAKSIVFIEEDENGEKITNQVNGCACWHPELIGFVRVLVEENDFSQKWFNPDFWYSLHHKESGVIGQQFIEQISFKGARYNSLIDFYRTYKPLKSEPKQKGSFMDYFSEIEKWRMANDPVFSSFYAKMDKLEEKIKSSEHFYSYSKMTQEVESALNGIKTPDMEFIKITKPFPDSVEAWVSVEITYKNGNKKSGVITWENCD